MSTPERRRQERRRFDHHESYVAWHVGLLVVMIGMVLSPVPPPGANLAFSWASQQLLAAVMLIGSGSALLGALIGTRFLLPDTVRKPLDLRVPYGFALFSLVATTSSMAIFEYAALGIRGAHTLSQMLMSLGFGCAFILSAIPFAFRLIWQIRVRTRMHKELTTEAREVADEIRRGK